MKKAGRLHWKNMVLIILPERSTIFKAIKNFLVSLLRLYKRRKSCRGQSIYFILRPSENLRRNRREYGFV